MLKYEPIKIRHAFIRKVYVLLIINLLTMFGILSLMTFVKPVHLFFVEYYYLVAIPLALHIAILIVFMCCDYVQREHPCNLILFFTLGITGGFLLGFICIFVNPLAVVIAMGVTIGLVLLLTLFAFQTRLDVTKWYIYPIILVIMLLILGIFYIIIRGPILRMVYCGIGILLFTFLIVYDTQLMMGSKRHSYSPEDYVECAVNLFIDIQLLFTFVVGVVSLFTSE